MYSQAKLTEFLEANQSPHHDMYIRSYDALNGHSCMQQPETCVLFIKLITGRCRDVCAQPYRLVRVSRNTILGCVVTGLLEFNLYVRRLAVCKAVYINASMIMSV